MGSINYLTAYNKKKCVVFDDVCTIQSFIISDRFFYP